MKRFLLGLFLLLLATPTFALGATEAQRLEAFLFSEPELLWCYDGDTCTFHFPNIPPVLQPERRIRFRGVDTAEKKTYQCDHERILAFKALRFVQETLKRAGSIEILEVGKGKWWKKSGRILAWVIVDGKNLSQMLIEEGLGVPYFGGRRPSWCTE